MKPQTQEEKDKALQEGAIKIVNFSRKQLASNIPPFALAIYFFEPEAVETGSKMFTDGYKLFYDPKTVVNNYLEDKASIEAQLLHIVLHGIQGHFLKRSGINVDLFDAIADIKTANLMKIFGYGYYQERDAFNGVSLEAACDSVRTAREYNTVRRLSRPARSDDHSLWNRPPDSPSGSAAGQFPTSLYEQWNNISLNALQQLSDSRQWGDAAGTISEIYREEEASGISYTELLKRFLLPDEIQAVDPDSINRIWYHVGISEYGNIPLIEPDELREDGMNIEIAVALDTSGSCVGNVLQRFLRELLSVVRDSGNRKLSLTLLQCDAAVQKVHHLTSEDEVKELVRTFRMQGGGGTDFRPVFDYLKKQAETDEGLPFRGLIYLSDG